MLGSWGEHNTPQEQIKNIIENNSQRMQNRAMERLRDAAKNCMQIAVLIVTR
jgi:hypothetical protein